MTFNYDLTIDADGNPVIAQIMRLAHQRARAKMIENKEWAWRFPSLEGEAYAEAFAFCLRSVWSFCRDRQIALKMIRRIFIPAIPMPADIARELAKSGVQMEL